MVQPTEVQPPMTAHPAYANEHASLLSILRPDAPMNPVRVVKPSRPLTASYDASPVFGNAVTDTRTLDIKKAYGPAPFVGDPFHYFWKIAVDELGRQIAGESWIEYWPETVVFEWEAGLRR